MKKNIGTSGRLFRLAIALLLLAFAYWQSSWIALGVGLFVLYEAVASWCLFYQLMGKNSCPLSKR